MSKYKILVTGACGVTSRSVVRSLNKSKILLVSVILSVRMYATMNMEFMKDCIKKSIKFLILMIQHIGQ